jgi:hypothetical protein
LLAAIRTELEVEDTEGYLTRIEREDDYLDAFVCALVARAVELGATHSPEMDDEIEHAAIEGWIHLPDQPLGLLAG